MAGSLDLKRLRYFRAIAEHGSLSAAARALNLAQPALSHHVTELETSLGVRLLERRHDGVVLTEAGRLLLRHAVDIGTRVDLAEAELNRFARDAGGKVKIRLAVIGSLAADLTPILVEALARDMPEVVLRITEAGTLDSRELLDRGEADLAVHLTANGGDDALLATERLYFVTAVATGGATGPIAFADVVARRLILPAQGNPLRGFIEQAASRAGYRLDIALEIDGAEPRRQAVLAGLGSTILGAHSVAASDAASRLAARPITGPDLFRPIYLGARRGLDPALVSRIGIALARSLEGFDIEIAPRAQTAVRD
jgi:LysR family nitrogen assimilation transcriptional regulator